MSDPFDFYAPLGDPVWKKWEAVLVRLVQTSRTRFEYARKLREKGCPDEISTALLDKFVEIGLIDDRACALLYIDAKRAYGTRRLRDELRARGVSRDDIDDALDECEVDETARALELARKWSGHIGMTREKLEARLWRRGFSGRAIGEVLEEIDAEDSEQ